MNDWKTKKYIQVVENTTNSSLKEYIRVELDYILGIEDLKNKTFIDVGAGYGRIITRLSKVAKNIFAVEIDKQMLKELENRALQFKNVSVIECDAQELSNCLKILDIKNPVVACLQNSLGTPYGDSFKIISEMIKVAKSNSGEIVISLFTQESLKEHGVSIYNSISALSGEPDLEKTDFSKGNFISKTGYKSHWWTPEERQKIVKMAGGLIVSEIKGSCFYILHIKY